LQRFPDKRRDNLHQCFVTGHDGTIPSVKSAINS
jgi:hypothetical protein